MVFYFLFLLVIAILCGRYNLIQGKYLIKKNSGYKIAIIFIIIISSIRFNIGYDWSTYFSFVYPNYNPKFLPNHEPLNKFIYMFAGQLNQPWVLFFIYAIITYTLIGIVINENSSSKYESLLIYLCLFYLPGISTIRQEIAVSIVLYGYKYIRKKRFFKYAIICFIAMCFHKTAIIGFLIYPIYNFKVSTNIFIALLLGIFLKIILPKLLDVFFPAFLVYLKKGGLGDSSGRLIKLFYLILLIYCFILQKKRITAPGLLNICTIGCIMPFLLGSHAGGRLSEYFLIYYSLLIPECNKRFKIEYRVIFLFPLYAFFFMYLYVSVNVNHSNEYVPFRWYPLENLEQELQ